MKTIFVAALVAAVPLAAQASDLPSKKAPAKAVAVEQANTNWNGAYFGAHAGYGWARNGITDFTAYDNTGDTGEYSDTAPAFSLDGFAGGAQIGIDQRFGDVIAGVVLDGSIGDIKGEFTGSSDYSAALQIDALASLRGRLGIAVDNALLYATGGLAWANVKADHNDYYGDTTYSSSATESKFGWVAGAGLEFYVTKNVTLGAEYLHYNFGTIDLTFNPNKGGATPDGWDQIVTSSHLTADVGRVTVNYRF